MKLFTSLSEITTEIARPVATIGNIDGLHRGHRTIVDRILTRAGAAGTRSLLITFEPHPLRVLVPERAPSMLTTRRQKLALLENAGLDSVLILPFTPELAAVRAEPFVRDYLVAGIGIMEIHVGQNFNFGRHREGDADRLLELCAGTGIHAEKVPEILYLGSPISSSRIRRALCAGEVELARELLGRPYGLEGTVVRGAGRGAGLGFPTANLVPEDQLVPQDGVYVTLVDVAGRAVPSVTNIGSRPTFKNARFAIEAHLLEAGRDLYGQSIEVRFLARLRPELKFESPEALVRQVRRDVERARAYFEADRPPGEAS